jgi:hypothetical protein
LIACEFSGVVRDCFYKKGHDAWSCDILPTKSKGNHIQDSVLNHLDKNWDLMIAHPPCTYLSRAGARWLYPNRKLNNKRYKKGIQAKNFFMKLYNAPIKKIAIENPVPIKIFNLPEHTISIQPYQFGHDVSKQTLLWLKPSKDEPMKKTSNYKQLLPSNTGGKKFGKKYSFSNIGSIQSSITFKGVAEAMAMQWG